MKEADVQKAIFELLIYHKFLVIRINQGAHTVTQTPTSKRRHIRFAMWNVLGRQKRSAGIADILAVAPNGKLWAIEVKAPGKLKRLTDHQKIFLDEVDWHGGVAFVADSTELVEEKLREHGWRSL